MLIRIPYERRLTNRPNPRKAALSAGLLSTVRTKIKRTFLYRINCFVRSSATRLSDLFQLASSRCAAGCRIDYAASPIGAIRGMALLPCDQIIEGLMEPLSLEV